MRYSSFHKINIMKKQSHMRVEGCTFSTQISSLFVARIFAHAFFCFLLVTRTFIDVDLESLPNQEMWFCIRHSVHQDKEALIVELRSDRCFASRIEYRFAVCNCANLFQLKCILRVFDEYKRICVIIHQCRIANCFFSGIFPSWFSFVSDLIKFRYFYKFITYGDFLFDIK